MNKVVRNTLYSSGFIMFSLGYYRGCQYYYHNEIKDNNINIGIKDFALCNVLGLIYGSIYINPAFACFAIYDEYEKYKMRSEKVIDEKKYFNNSYFLLNKK